MTEKDDGVTIYDEFGHGPEADLRRHLWLKTGGPKPTAKPKSEKPTPPKKGE